ncbi:adenylosuccinate lyase [Geosmithia morbida]|uniref:Adenylosuccinate lyase n=1 Tax=Geosmithia morbida TaxID=1094350 RepID=A0A9P5D8S8_9HYPO|nr:adenylosuccinate lyase [Geosmithia morbida]KAF4125824.1 adenylosuccinate lyase [Geosmithia morbida]
MANSSSSTASSAFDSYQTSLTTRYCSPAMSKLFSQRSRHSTWRKLWLALAESEKELGVDTITDEALDQMRAHLTVTDDDFEVARIEEKSRRHVSQSLCHRFIHESAPSASGHVHAFGAVAPAASGILHLGATSCFVTDNTELILVREAMDLIAKKIAKVIHNLSAFAVKWKAEPTLAYTHLQAAQLITVGKRAAQWVLDLMLDLHAIEQVSRELKFRGAQGTTGTQASFLSIFEGDAAKCDRLNDLLCAKFGFPSCYEVSTQTYTRKVDLIIANAVAGLGSTAQKITGDIRHLMHWKEIEEPFESSQIGSSAMAYKRNPMRSERVYSLARELMSKPASFAATHSDQWAERTLDDSAIRRIDIPEMFLLADAICIGLDNISDGLVVYPGTCSPESVPWNLPFMITEEIIMRLCAKGVSRQEAHEQIRVLSHEAGAVVKQEGKPNPLVDKIRANDFFKPIWGELDGMLKAELYTGRSSQIVDKYCGPGGAVEKALAPYEEYIKSSATAKLNV